MASQRRRGETALLKGARNSDLQSQPPWPPRVSHSSSAGFYRLARLSTNAKAMRVSTAHLSCTTSDTATTESRKGRALGCARFEFNLVLRLGTEMSFKDVLKSIEPMVVQTLQARAAISNRMAKAVDHGNDRRRLYEQKSDALSRLIVLRAGRVVELRLAQGDITVSLPNGRRLHVPVNQLSRKAMDVVQASVRDHLALGREARNNGLISLEENVKHSRWFAR